jgi:hypothetical protein
VVFDGFVVHGRTAMVLQHDRLVSMERLAKPVGNDSLAILGAVDKMNVEACE